MPTVIIGLKQTTLPTLECMTFSSFKTIVKYLCHVSIPLHLWVSRNGGPVLCTGSIGTLSYLDSEGLQPKLIIQLAPMPLLPISYKHIITVETCSD